jgi:hypothetical protein
MTYVEFDNTFDIFVGDLLGSSVLDTNISQTGVTLRVTDIKQDGIDQTNTRVFVFYSTENSPVLEAIPDSAASWVEQFDISTIEESVKTYYDYSTEELVDWPTKWTDNTPSGASSEVPELVIRRPLHTFIVTAYASSLYLVRIMNQLGTINSNAFLSGYFSFFPQSNINAFANIADTRKWLFTACPITRVAKDSWRYDFTFEYNPNGWNHVEGLDVEIYDESNLNGLFAGMDRIVETDVSVRTGRGV